MIVSDDPECDPNLIVGPELGPDGKGKALYGLKIYNYYQLDSIQKRIFDKVLENGELTIRNGIDILSEDLATELGTDYIAGGTFPVSIVDSAFYISFRK